MILRKIFQGKVFKYGFTQKYPCFLNVMFWGRKTKNHQIIFVMVSEMYIFDLELYLGNNLKL